MSTYNLNFDKCTKDQFPTDLIFVGNQIYKGIRDLAKTTAGIIVLLPLGIASLIILPITYLLIGIILTYYIFRTKKLSDKILRVIVTNENYTKFYDLFLTSGKIVSDLEVIEKNRNNGAKGLLLKPVLYFFKKIHSLVSKINNHLELQLFEPHDPSEISNEDVEFFRKQVNQTEDDWYDDALWKDFQIKYHHLAN